MPILHRYIRRVRQIWIARAIFAAFVLLLAAALTSAIAGGMHRDPAITLQAFEQALRSEGVSLTAQPAAEPLLRGVQPQRFSLGIAGADAAASHRESFAVYIFSSPRERSRAEEELLRTNSYQGAAQAPIVYRRSNVLLLYRPLVVVNQSGTRYGDLLEQALDNSADSGR